MNKSAKVDEDKKHINPFAIKLTENTLGVKTITLQNYILIRALIDGQKKRNDINNWCAHNKDICGDVRISNPSDMAKDINRKTFSDLILMPKDNGGLGYSINTEKYSVKF